MSITTEVRKDLIALVVGVYGAAPGTALLSTLANTYNANPNMAAVALSLQSSAPFIAAYPSFMTNTEFATRVVDNILEGRVSAADRTWAIDTLVANLNSGAGRAELILSAVIELQRTTNPAWADAKAAFVNQVDVATYHTVTLQKDGTLAERVAVIANVDQTAASAESAKVAQGGQAATDAAETVTLTASVDVVVTGSGNDVINAQIDGTTDAITSTLTPLDSINGGNGSDTLNLYVLNGAGAAGTAAQLPAGLIINSVETANVRSAVDLTADVSKWTGLTAANVTQGLGVDVTAASTTAVSVSGTTGAVKVTGGLSQTVNSGAGVEVSGSAGAVSISGATGTVNVNNGANVTVSAGTAGQGVNIGLTKVNAGSVAVTHTNQTSGAITIDGGTDVAVTSTKATTGTVSVGLGGAATDLATGAITVNTTGAAYTKDDVNAARGDIDIVGGSSVTVNQTATSSTAAAAADTSNTTVNQSDISITGGALTTAVTVNQSAPATAVNAVATVAAVNQVDKVNFVAMAAGESITVGGLTFTASKALTAAQAAAAFANLPAGGQPQGASSAANGIYSGNFDSGYSTGAVTTTDGVTSVNATVATAAAGNTAIEVDDTVNAGNVTSSNTTAGKAAAGKAGVMGVVGGAITVNGAITGTDVLTTAWLNGYGAGSSVTSDALSNLTLANSTQALTVNNSESKTLSLTLNAVGTSKASPTIALGGTYTTLNVNTTGSSSDLVLTGAAIQTLNVAGDKNLDLNATSLAALKTVSVSGSAGLTINASGATVTSVSTAATTGSVTATVNGSKATYTGGAGKDTVTLSSSTVSKAISTGNGDDTITFADGTTALAASVNGGDGTDTLVMKGSDAVTASATSDFALKLDGIEKLAIKTVAAGSGALSINLANLDNISYVVSNGIEAAIPGPDEAAIVEFKALKAGQSVTVAGVTVTAQVDITAADVQLAFLNGGTTNNATVNGSLSGWSISGPHQNGLLTFTSTTAGNVTNLTASDLDAPAPADPLVVTTAAVNGSADVAKVSYSTLLSGETTVVNDGNGNTITVTAPQGGFEQVYLVKDINQQVTVNPGTTLSVNGAVYEFTQQGGNTIGAFLPIIAIKADGSPNDGWVLKSGTPTYGATDVGILTSLTPGNVTNLTGVDIVVNGNNNVNVLSVEEGTPASNLTAVQVATAIESAVKGGQAVANVTTSGVFTDWTASRSTNTVTFTSTKAGLGNVSDLSIENSGAVVSYTQGIDAVPENSLVTFTPLFSGQSVTVGGQTVTAAANLTAAEIEAAFVAGVTTGNATVSGALKGFTAGQAGNGSVKFTSTTLGDVTDIVVTTAVVGSPTDVVITTKDGSAGTPAGSLTITKMANNGTLELTAPNSGATTVTMADATGSADSFNIAAMLAGDFVDFGTVSVAGVETVNIMTTNSVATSTAYATLTVSNSAAKAINVTGNGGLQLGASSSSLKNVDASAATGGLVFTSTVDGAVVKGGAGLNYLVGTGNGQTIIGGAGTDILAIAGDLATLTGGAGRDVFAIGDATTNVNSYATITDFAAGDMIQFSAGAADFMPAKVTLGATAVFQDLANAAIANSDNGDVAWFQHGGDTYVIENVSNNVSTFINGTDIIVKIVGLVDFSNASFNSSGDTLAIG